MTNTRILIFAGMTALGLHAIPSSAAPVNNGYLVDSSGKPVRNGGNGCARTGYWTPALSIAECDPDLDDTQGAKKAAAAKPVVAPAHAADPAIAPAQSADPVVAPPPPPAIPGTPRPETLFGL